METITFYAYKGGTGRTSLVAHTARYLALSGKKVVAADLDLEAPGLHYRLGSDAENAPGIVEYLVSALEAHRTPVRPLTDFLRPAPLPKESEGQLWLLPAGPAPQADYWKQLTRLARMAPLFDAEGAGLAALLDLQARIDDELHPDYLLLDARTGISEIGGVAAAVLADKVVCLLVENRESLDGTRAVLRSLRRTNRPSRRPVEVFPVLSRVTRDVDQARRDVLAQLNDDVRKSDQLPELYIIRADPRVEPGKYPVHGPPQGAYRDYQFLLGAVVPSGSVRVSPAWSRHTAVQSLVDWLTRQGYWADYVDGEPNAFGVGLIDEGVHVDGPEGRYADLVVFADADHNEPLLAAEYVGDELKTSTAWAWWQANTDLRCVILFDARNRRVFTRGRRGGAFIDRGDVYRGAAWGVQWPVSFTALDDPGDRSVPSLLGAVRQGERAFVSLLVEQWQHATWSGLHGGFEPNPRLAKEILDGLASLKDEEEWAALYYTAPDDIERGHRRLRREEAMFEEHTTRELHAPLWWRLSAKSKTEHGHHHPFHRRATPAGVQLLASDIMGLTFDQDREYRVEVARVGSERSLLGSLIRELTFVITTDPPPELVRRAALDRGDLRSLNWIADSDKEALQEAKAEYVAHATLDRLLRDREERVCVVTTNLLGGYDATSCQVVLYQPVVAWCADAIGAEQRALENVVLLHETVHALCHLGLDLDWNRWDDFALPTSRHPTFRPSALHEGLAQYFTFRMLERLDDRAMISAFDRLTNVQPPEYQAWRLMRSVPLEQARNALLRARAGSSSILSEFLQPPKSSPDSRT